jgi:pre-mRNA-processing factor 6
VGNLTGKRRKLNPRDGRSFVVPDSILVGDRDKAGFVNSLDPMQQAVRFHLFVRLPFADCAWQNGGFETPATSDGMADLLGISQARDKVLSLKLDQVRDINIVKQSYSPSL